MVAAMRSASGVSRFLVRSALEERPVIKLLTSVSLMLEYEAVMTRPEHLEAAEGSVEGVARVLDAVSAVSEQVRIAFLWRPTLPDASDDMVLEVGVNGRADAIVTYNRRDFAGASRFPVAIMSPLEVVNQLRTPR